MRTKKSSNIVDAILENADGLHRIGLMDDNTFRSIIVRLLGEAAAANIEPISGSEIRKMRLRAKLSQASFAGHFNRTRSYISRIERGINEPKGAALVLFNVIRRKGFEAIV